MKKIVDAFLFAGEMDMLKFRKDIMAPFDVIHVIVEDTKTHQGEPRDWSCKDMSSDNVIVHRTDIPLDPDNERAVEIGQREAVLDACANMPDDWILMAGDVDEIPSRESLEEIAGGAELPRCCAMEFFYYKLNHRRPEECSVVVCTLGFARAFGGMEHLRRQRGSYPFLTSYPSGWHLSFFGGVSAIQKKLRSYGHWQFNQPQYLDADWIEKCQAEGLGVLKCATKFQRVNKGYFPDYIIDLAPKDWWL